MDWPDLLRDWEQVFQVHPGVLPVPHGLMPDWVVVQCGVEQVGFGRGGREEHVYGGVNVRTD